MLTISTKKSRFVLKEDEKICQEWFNRLVGGIINAEKAAADELAVEEGVREPDDLEEKAGYQVGDLLEDIPAEKAESPGDGYKGFLYIKCPSCGAVRGQCSKKGMHRIHCDNCGCNEPFTEPLTPMFVNCECGARFRYMTNMKEDMFDITCINCGSPVPIKYNGKKMIYQTIK